MWSYLFFINPSLLARIQILITKFLLYMSHHLKHLFIGHNFYVIIGQLVIEEVCLIWLLRHLYAEYSPMLDHDFSYFSHK